MKIIINILKAAIISIIVAFVFVGIISFAAIKVGGETFKMATNLVDLITVKTSAIQTMEEPVLEENKLINHPAEGTKYGTIRIEKVNLELPVYFGQSYTVLKSGIGHDSSSYFPGEGGSVIYMGHNFKKFLAKLPELENGDEIEVETSYGTFEYEVYDSKIVLETEVDKVPIQNKEEILMIYTCYPINNIGHAYQRYVVYAKPISY